MELRPRCALFESHVSLLHRSFETCTVAGPAGPAFKGRVEWRSKGEMFTSGPRKEVVMPRPLKHHAVKRNGVPLITTAPAPAALPDVAAAYSANSAAFRQDVRMGLPGDSRDSSSIRAAMIKSMEEQLTAEMRREHQRAPSVPVVIARPNRSKDREFAEAEERKRKSWLRRKSESSLESWEDRHAMEAGCSPSRSRTSDRAIRYDLVRSIVDALLAEFCDEEASREAREEEDKDKSHSRSTVRLEDVRDLLDGVMARITRGVASATVIQLCQEGKGWLALHVHDIWEAQGVSFTKPAYISLTAALARSGPFVESARIFSSMRSKGLGPTRQAFTAAMQGEAKAGVGRWRSVVTRLEEMREVGIRPDIVAYNCAIAACGRAGRVAESEALWRRLLFEGLTPSMGTHSLLMSTFVQAGRCDLAMEVLFDARLAGGPVPHDMMKGAVCAAAKAGRWALAMDLLEELVAQVVGADWKEKLAWGVGDEGRVESLLSDAHLVSETDLEAEEKGVAIRGEEKKSEGQEDMQERDRRAGRGGTWDTSNRQPVGALNGEPGTSVVADSVRVEPMDCARIMTQRCDEAILVPRLIGGPDGREAVALDTEAAERMGRGMGVGMGSAVPVSAATGLPLLHSGVLAPAPLSAKDTESSTNGNSNGEGVRHGESEGEGVGRKYVDDGRPASDQAVVRKAVRGQAGGSSSRHLLRLPAAPPCHAMPAPAELVAAACPTMLYALPTGGQAAAVELSMHVPAVQATRGAQEEGEPDAAERRSHPAVQLAVRSSGGQEGDDVNALASPASWKDSCLDSQADRPIVASSSQHHSTLAGDAFEGVCRTASGAEAPLDSPPLSIITFNAVISSLARAGRSQLACAVYRLMLRLGIAPDLFTWSGLASALAREGEYEQVVLVGEEMMARHGLWPNQVVCNCVLLACQRTGRWREAVEQLARMERMGVQADVRSYASVMVACECAGQWRVALETYQGMQLAGCQPNSFVFAALLRTLGRARRWRQAVAVYEDAEVLGPIGANAHVKEAFLAALHNSKKYDVAEKCRVRMAAFRGHMATFASRECS